MGVLDDAIREHLELKRLHGAAEDDLRRQEEEALGPARREVAPAEDDDTGEQVAAEAEDAPAAEAQPELYDEPPSEELELPEEPADEEPAEEEPAVAVAEEDPPQDTAEHEFEELDEDELPSGEAEEEEPLDQQQADADADLLEDTPDFLQETPEHDRLWFEQKPPRDFDFD